MCTQRATALVSINLMTRRSTDKRLKMKGGEDGDDGSGQSQKQRRTTPARMTATDKGFAAQYVKKRDRELLKLREKDEHLKNPPYYCDECSSPKIKGTQVSRVDFLMSIGTIEVLYIQLYGLREIGLL